MSARTESGSDLRDIQQVFSTDGNDDLLLPELARQVQIQDAVVADEGDHRCRIIGLDQKRSDTACVLVEGGDRDLWLFPENAGIERNLRGISIAGRRQVAFCARVGESELH